MPIGKQFTTVTTFSKFTALALFVALPFMGFYAGVKYQKNEPLVAPTKPALTAQPTKADVKKVCLQDSDCSLGKKCFECHGMTQNKYAPEKQCLTQEEINKLKIQCGTM